MIPVAALPCVPHCLRRHAKYFRPFAIRFSDSPNSENVAIIQLCPTVFGAITISAVLEPISSIAALGVPSQVAKRVVFAVSVIVAGFQARWALPNESLKHHDVQTLTVALPISTK